MPLRPRPPLPGQLPARQSRGDARDGHRIQLGQSPHLLADGSGERRELVDRGPFHSRCRTPRLGPRYHPGGGRTADRGIPRPEHGPELRPGGVPGPGRRHAAGRLHPERHSGGGCAPAAVPEAEQGPGPVAAAAQRKSRHPRISPATGGTTCAASICAPAPSSTRRRTCR